MTNQPISTADKINGLMTSLMLAGQRTDGESVMISTMRAVAMHELQKIAELAEIGRQAVEMQEVARRSGAVMKNTGAFAGEWVR